MSHANGFFGLSAAHFHWCFSFGEGAIILINEPLENKTMANICNRTHMSQYMLYHLRASNNRMENFGVTSKHATNFSNSMRPNNFPAKNGRNKTSRARLFLNKKQHSKPHLMWATFFRVLHLCFKHAECARLACLFIVLCIFVVVKLLFTTYLLETWTYFSWHKLFVSST